MINRVTITGADDFTSIDEMHKISEEFPFVEWGILVMPDRFGRPRYPSLDWIKSLIKNNAGLKLSLHLCGGYVTNVLTEPAIGLPAEHGLDWSVFKRMQINTHGEATYFHESRMLTLMKGMNQAYGTEFIFQYDNVNTAVDVASRAGIICSALFDLSHGVGRLPSQWPEPLETIRCGYAGGLGPNNLTAQIRLILDKTGDIPIWIDMETHVRSEREDLGTNILDLFKVQMCLNLAKPFIQ
jgi:hypothetical protein